MQTLQILQIWFEFLGHSSEEYFKIVKMIKKVILITVDVKI